MLEAILLALVGYVFMFIWLETDAFYEYFSFIIKRVNNDYETNIDPNFKGNFIKFIAINKNNFFTRLISCPYCIAFWISLLISLSTSFIYFGLIYFIILTSFFLSVKISK